MKDRIAWITSPFLIRPISSRSRHPVVDMCHSTQSDYQASNPPLKLPGWVRGLRMIRHTTNNPAPSISTVRGCCCSPYCRCMSEGAIMQSWIMCVPLADMWTDSCQQDVLNQSAVQAPYLSATLGPSLIGGAVNPVSLFRGFVCCNGYP